MSKATVKEMTGFVAWHPERGVARPEPYVTSVFFDKRECADYCALRFFGNAYHESRNRVELIKTKGWRVRPVKLVFTDEEKEQASDE